MPVSVICHSELLSPIKIRPRMYVRHSTYIMYELNGFLQKRNPISGLQCLKLFAYFVNKEPILLPFISKKNLLRTSTNIY